MVDADNEHDLLMSMMCDEKTDQNTTRDSFLAANKSSAGHSLKRTQFWIVLGIMHLI